jgi:hypothetical protein
MNAVERLKVMIAQDINDAPAAPESAESAFPLWVLGPELLALWKSTSKLMQVPHGELDTPNLTDLQVMYDCLVRLNARAAEVLGEDTNG